MIFGSLRALVVLLCSYLMSVCFVYVGCVGLDAIAANSWGCGSTAFGFGLGLFGYCWFEGLFYCGLELSVWLGFAWFWVLLCFAYLCSFGSWIVVFTLVAAGIIMFMVCVGGLLLI